MEEKKKRRGLLKRDALGNIVFLKKLLISLLGAATYPRFKWLHKIAISGTEHLEGLPETNVLFVSNHQTYFADVIAILHVFNSARFKFKNKIGAPVYLLAPRHNNYFVAAEETMKAGILPKIFTYAGSVNIQRTFREAGKDINRQVKMDDISKIGDALSDGWVLTFPQGTTTPFAPGRRGVTHIIKKYGPVVVPVVIGGFNRAFDKKGLRVRNRKARLSIRFKPPMKLNLEMEPDLMLEQIMEAIEQSEKFKPASKSLTQA
ncbi:MAG: lysophospholipid acyltransferase family protein [Bacteroidota bacterium]